MAIEFDYTNKDFELIAGLEPTSTPDADGDYVRIIVYPREAVNNIVTIDDKQAIFYSSMNVLPFNINISPFSDGYQTRIVGGEKNDFKIYQNGENIYIKPNEIFDEFQLPQGDYKIQVDFLNQFNPLFGPDSPLNYEDLPYPYWFEEYDINFDNSLDTIDVVQWGSAGRPDIMYDLAGDDNPDNIINTGNFPPKHSETEFNDDNPPLNPVSYFFNDISDFFPEAGVFKFIIKQISTSRKEIRLELRDVKITSEIAAGAKFIDYVTEQLNTNLNDGTVENSYQFGYVLNVGNGNHIPILNYQFDRLTNGKDNQSIILKLYEPISLNLNNLDFVTIEREVLTTQTQDIFYFSDVPDVFFGDGLEPDLQENWINFDGSNIQFESFNQISSSIDAINLESIISKSEYDYDNLNTDFSNFENHTFFGSAKKKIENFNSKIETIQSYYSEISSSLSSTGEEIISSSIFLKQKRQDLFDKINKEIQTFTPYERFLYYDGQSESTASAPSLGKNYVDKVPLFQSPHGKFNILNNYDGFNTVYQRTTEGLSTNSQVNLFTGKYKVHEKPFYNYSGSIYLSFLAKGSDVIGGLTSSINQHLLLGTSQNGFALPHDTAFTSSIFNPHLTGSEYQRYVFQESRSYFVPSTANNDMGELNSANGDFDLGSTKIIILSGSGIKTGSGKMRDSINVYPTTVVSQSNVPFFGSVMPAGNMFNISFDSGSLREIKITDVKVTLNNPSNVLPFDNVFKTTSTEWTTWYNNALTTAETFDTNNIHSFENNLPLYIQESSDYNDMKDFLNLQGEQYDLIRNHIDSMGTIHKRGYKKTDSPPNNILPMLLNNMGWQAINPFSGSLSDSLGEYLTGVTSIDDIKNNTWRKTLNNLIYIYKSKGTKNAVRGLLNTYGYPPDVLEFQEFGGSIGSQIGGDSFLNDAQPISLTTDYDANTSIGSFGFVETPKKLYQHMFTAPTSLHKRRIINFDWWMNQADLNTIEFVYRHYNTTNTQIMLESSGSDGETLWDLRLVPSADGTSGSFAFRLNDSNTGSLAIASNAFSMSTDYFRLHDGELWNVMIQRMTGSSRGVGRGTNEYRLHSSLQEKEKIKTYSYVTMSISGGITADSTLGGKGHFANQNWPSSGSRHYLTGSNLVVGKTVTGSFSQVKGWNTALSTSKFRQHTLNKFSTVGNNINSHRKELVYHFKLNENYTTSSVSASNQLLTIVDSAPKTTLTTDYSFQRSASHYTGSSVYTFDNISTINFTIQDNSQKQNDKHIIIKPKKTILRDLNPNKPAVDSLLNPIGKKPQYKSSTKLELYRSPQTFVDNFILNTIGGNNLETIYANPLNYYSHSYAELDEFRKDFFKAHPIEVDVNKFVRSYENIINNSIVEGVKSIVPARSTFSDRNSNFGVEIKPTILEKQKYENEEHSVEVNPNTATGSINILSIKDYLTGAKTGSLHRNTTGLNLLGSNYESSKKGTVLINVAASSSYEIPYSASISMGNQYSESVGYIHPPFLQPAGYVTSIVNPYSASISIISSVIHLSSSKAVTRLKDSSGISLTGSILIFPPSGTIDYASDNNKSFVNIHSNWGTSSNDVHFINFAGDSGSNEDYNVGHIDTRFHFYSIGDNEYYSSSIATSIGETNFENSSRFFNRIMMSSDFHSSVNYESLINITPGLHSGRMIGKTRYFTTSSDGNIILPANHVTKFSNPFKNRMYLGAQNTKPGRLNFQNYEDLSTSSFYSISVTSGESEIVVRGNKNPNIGSNDRIIYD